MITDAYKGVYRHATEHRNVTSMRIKSGRHSVTALTLVVGLSESHKKNVTHSCVQVWTGK
jgi:hypothetical protein